MDLRRLGRTLLSGLRARLSGGQVSRESLTSSPYYRGRYESVTLARRHPHHPAPLVFDIPSGVFAVPADAEGDLIVRTIAQGAVFEQEIVTTAQGYLRAGETILDVGANLGQMTVLFARAVGPAGTVVAFEADDYIADLLRLNVELNGLANVDVVEAGVWNRSELPLRYPQPDLRRFGTYGSYGIDPSATQGRIVKSVTIDSLQYRSPVSFLKVDIQGSDLFGLQGAVETIRTNQMPILFEYEPLLQDQFGTSLGDYMAFVEQIGYRVAKVINGINYLILPRTAGGEHSAPTG
jgi:FkbM family methyltransferase